MSGIKNKIIILSDIHIGTNEPTNWYQSSIHQPYLVAALDYVIANSAGISELVLLGDLVDFWTYLPDQTPPDFYNDLPSVKTIVGANPGIFGFNKPASMGPLAKASVMVDKCVFIPGNHDMTMTQDMLNKIFGAKITLEKAGFYSPMGDKHIVCTHGHDFSMMCAPDFEKANALSPLPIGYYATRAGAYYANQQLKKSGKKNVAELPNTGEPSGVNFTDADYADIVAYAATHSVGAGIADAIYKVTGFGWDSTITLPHVAGHSWPKITTLDKAGSNFSDLFDTWKNKTSPNGEKLGYTGAWKALKDPDVDNNLAPYAKEIAQSSLSKIVVMGHTHVPLDGKSALQELKTESGSNFIYANSGFNCPSVPDMNNTANPKHPTFIEIEVLKSGYAVSVRKIVHTNGVYKVADKPLMGPVTISA
ncbi:metallophosphoesterase [Sedimenticola sp.]|uniref:metallophosphoesterase n=1 Tax=Sedimenticola sp. TaxID=1940285 RepID=UPI003D0CBB2A